MTRFTESDVDHAHADWFCTCGPAALAAIYDLTLDEVRPHFNPAFPGYTTPTRMYQALRNAGVKWRPLVGPVGSPLATWPKYGCCIQTGPSPTMTRCAYGTFEYAWKRDAINAAARSEPTNPHCGVVGCPGGPLHAHDPNDWTSAARSEK